MRAFRWVLFLVDAAAALAVAGAWFFSQFRMTSYYSFSRWPSFMAYRNAIYFSRGGLYRLPGWEVSNQLGGAGGWWVSRGTGWLSVPFWMPLAVLAVTSLALWHFRPGKRHRAGCVQCGYNLTGNVSGRCPECGTAVAV